MKLKLPIYGLLVLILLSACLPTEAPPLPPPTTTIPEGRTMRTFLVESGDVLRFSNPPVQYLPLQQEALHFNVAGRRIGGIFASLGDFVQEGDLLATLENPYAYYQLRDAQWELDWRQLELRQLNAMHNLVASGAALSAADIASHRREQTRLQGEIELARMRINQIQNETANMEILAPFSGVVTWVMDFGGVMWSSVGQPVITISDQGQYIFRLAGADTQFVTIGEYYDISIAGEEFPALAMEAETNDDGETIAILFTLVGEHMPLITGNMTASVFLLHDGAFDVVMLPTMHINTVGDRHFVHVLEDDIIVIRDIALGLQGNAITEITAGLQAGDVVVLI